MRRAVQPRVLAPPLSEPPGLVKLHASVIAPPAEEGSLTPNLRHIFAPPSDPCRVRTFAARSLPTGSPRRASCSLSRPCGFRRRRKTCAGEIRFLGLHERSENCGPPSMVSNTNADERYSMLESTFPFRDTPWPTRKDP